MRWPPGSGPTAAWWSWAGTAHCVFRPARLAPEELEAGRAWLYRRLYSLRSIWARRPRQAAAVPTYLAMAVLYKRCNWLWRHLIRWRLTHAVWAPLVELSRRGHLRFRARLAGEASAPSSIDGRAGGAPTPSSTTPAATRPRAPAAAP